MNRRRFLAALAAGAVVTAEGLWVPGRKRRWWHRMMRLEMVAITNLPPV